MKRREYLLKQQKSIKISLYEWMKPYQKYRKKTESIDFIMIC